MEFGRGSPGGGGNAKGKMQNVLINYPEAEPSRY